MSAPRIPHHNHLATNFLADILERQMKCALAVVCLAPWVGALLLFVARFIQLQFDPESK